MLTYSLSSYDKLLKRLNDKDVSADYEVIESYLMSGEFRSKVMAFNKKKVDEGISSLPLDKSKDLEKRLDDIEM